MTELEVAPPRVEEADVASTQADRSQPRSVLVRAAHGLATVMAVLAAVVTVVIGLVMLADVARRMATGRSVPGSFELVESLVTCVVFLGLAQAERKGANVRVTLVTSHVPDVVATGMRAVGVVVMVVVTAWLAWATGTSGLNSYRSGEFSDGIVQFPLWPARFVVALGFVSLLLVVVVNARDRVLGRRPEHFEAEGMVS